MKQSLQLKISQQLTMTPQLQQAIRLLQLSTVDLQQEIQTMVESNPMLELPDEPDAAFDADSTASPEPSGAADSRQSLSLLNRPISGARGHDSSRRSPTPVARGPIVSMRQRR